MRRLIHSSPPHGPVVAALALAAITYCIQNPGEIRIRAPANSAITNQTFADVVGTVENRRLDKVQLIVNGSARTVAVDNGNFSSRVPLFPGKNVIQASASGAVVNLTAGSEVVHVTAEIPRSDVWSELTWDGRGDIDLHLYLPNGEHCYYQQKKTNSGAWLDIDNTERDGPEHIILENAIPGRYRLTVLYFAANKVSRPAIPWKVTVRLKDGQIQRTYSGVLTVEKEEQLVDGFLFP